MRTILIVVFWASLTCSVAAQTVEQDGHQDLYSVFSERAQDTLLAYQEAMEAQQRCADHDFSRAELDAMNRIIAQEMALTTPQIYLGAARLLNLRHKARDDMRHIVNAEGCNGPNVATSLRLFADKLGL